ncbi:MAG: C40 family peptidase [Duncaniella sp.]|nr:C40 family peptidase [Duncaniella sp.]
MNILAKSSIILSIITIACSFNAKADETHAPYKLPAAHTVSTTFDVANRLIERAYESVRENSPFTEIEDEGSNIAESGIVDKMAEYAAKFLGTRYRLGAAGPKAFDCSGFVGYVFKQFGITLNRSSRAQYSQGEKVDKQDIKPGDLMFFSSRSSGKGRVGHVAMVVDVNEDGTLTFIHASTKKGVTYQKFPDNGYYSRHFIGARRIIGSEA